MNQNEHNAKNVADLAKLQAIKETTERLLHSDKDSTHSLVIVESITKQYVELWLTEIYNKS